MGSLEEVELGQWVNANIEKDATFLIDMDDMPKIDYKDKPSKVFETKDRPIYVIAYWIYGEYTITNVSEAEEYDYIISTQNLKYEIIKEGETIKIYKVPDYCIFADFTIDYYLFIFCSTHINHKQL